jgi:hypothetical protein
MTEIINDGPTGMIDYGMKPTKELLMMYVAEHGEIANALGRPNSPTYNPEAAKYLDEADKLYSLGLEGDNDVNNHGLEQKKVFIDALKMLNKAKEIIRL